jgi:hypothetical protein
MDTSRELVWRLRSVAVGGIYPSFGCLEHTI